MTNNMNSMVMRNMRRERIYKAVMIDLHSLGVLEDDEIENLIGYVPGGKKATPATEADTPDTASGTTAATEDAEA